MDRVDTTFKNWIHKETWRERYIEKEEVEDEKKNMNELELSVCVWSVFVLYAWGFDFSMYKLNGLNLLLNRSYIVRSCQTQDPKKINWWRLVVKLLPTICQKSHMVDDASFFSVHNEVILLTWSAFLRIIKFQSSHYKLNYHRSRCVLTFENSLNPIPFPIDLNNSTSTD